MRILVTRPRPDAGQQAERLAALGHEPIVEPLFDVRLLDCGPLPLADAQALIATSRNALRALAETGQLEEAASLSIYAVGRATARLAGQLGFSDIRAGGGTAEELASLIASDCAAGAGALVHLAGERLAWDLKGALERKGFTLLQPVLYRAVPAGHLSAIVQQAISSGTLDGVVLMSPATARTYASLISAAGLLDAAAGLKYFCLSANVAAELEPLGAAHVAVAATPSEDDLLALIGHEAANC